MSSPASEPSAPPPNTGTPISSPPKDTKGAQSCRRAAMIAAIVDIVISLGMGAGWAIIGVKIDWWVFSIPSMIPSLSALWSLLILVMKQSRWPSVMFVIWNVTRTLIDSSIFFTVIVKILLIKYGPIIPAGFSFSGGSGYNYGRYPSGSGGGFSGGGGGSIYRPYTFEPYVPEPPPPKIVGPPLPPYIGPHGRPVPAPGFPGSHTVFPPYPGPGPVRPIPYTRVGERARNGASDPSKNGGINIFAELPTEYLIGWGVGLLLLIILYFVFIGIICCYCESFKSKSISDNHPTEKTSSNAEPSQPSTAGDRPATAANSTMLSPAVQPETKDQI